MTGFWGWHAGCVERGDYAVARRGEEMIPLYSILFWSILFYPILSLPQSRSAFDSMCHGDASSRDRWIPTRTGDTWVWILQPPTINQGM
ncbi:hypothetical protein P154DRAFT_145012 [Amniculicola lignicola CBS 123094]|uniref:Uncharacterized protein n=1 Tax=Amniculicola lignicola CBS 123094 TaxID=1392246 RepID=A0A6A5WLA7_9PLEO|nr:hypothetical protein P154DRAFT_145012 [Amniculicola lignicola CBS 123094]